MSNAPQDGDPRAPATPKASLVTRICRKLAEVPAPYASFLAVRRSFRPTRFEYANMYILSLDLNQLDMTIAGMKQIKEITAKDEAYLGRLEEPVETVRDRFDRGQRVWIYEQDGRILAFDWIAGHRKTLSTWLIVGSAPGAFWGHFLKVHPDSRGLGLGPKLRAQICRVYARDGYSQLLSTVDVGNRNSLSYQIKAGAKPYGQVRFFSLFGMTLLRHGRRWRCGIWNAKRPLNLELEELAMPGLTIPQPKARRRTTVRCL